MDKLTLAEVLKPQGIKGELKLKNLSKSSDTILSAEDLFLNETKVSVSSLRENGDFLFIKFNEINSISEAERYRGAKLLADRSNLEGTLSEGEYFIEDLIGLDIVFESGEKVGTLTDIQNFGSADVFYVLKENGKEVLFSNVEGVIIKVEDKIIINKKRFEEVSV